MRFLEAMEAMDQAQAQPFPPEAVQEVESTRRGQPSVWVARGELPQTDLAV